LIREGPLAPQKIRRLQELGIAFDGKLFTYEGFRCDHIDDAIAHVEKTQQRPPLQVIGQKSLAPQVSAPHEIESFIELINNQSPVGKIIAALTKLDADGYDQESLELIVDDRVGIEGVRTLAEAYNLRRKQ